MTQADLARRLDVSRQTIIAIEKERFDPSLSLAFKISDVFSASVEQIFLRDRKELVAPRALREGQAQRAAAGKTKAAG